MALHSATRYSSAMIVKDHWRITTAAIQLEMERIADLLEKSERYKKRFAAAEAVRRRAAAAAAAAEAEADLSLPETTADLSNRIGA